MSNSIKKIVQNALLYPRKTKYNKEYLLLMDQYDSERDDIINKISGEETTKETSSLVELIDIDELLNANPQLEDDKYYFVCSKEFGEVLPESERVIYEYVKDNPYALVCYGDEDYFAFCQDGDGRCTTKYSRHFNRFYKPAYSPMTLTEYDYMGPIVVKGNILNKAIKGITNKGGKGLYELTFVACEMAINEAGEQTIVHIPRVLSSKGVQTDKNKLNLINQNGRAAEVLADELKDVFPNGSQPEYKDIRDKGRNQFNLEYNDKDLRISVIIPSKDNPDMLIKCIDNLKLSSEDNIEVIVVDNGSSDDNKAKIENYLSNVSFDNQYIYDPKEFNYSYMNNVGVKKSSGEIVILLNDDIEADGHAWINRLGNIASMDNIGCVGCKLVYPTGLIQHVGISCGVDGPAHELMGDEDIHGIAHGENEYNRNVLAVTGACLAVKRSLYEEVGGLFEELKVGYNDVDFCLTIAKMGYKNIVMNDIRLIHHESVTRGKDAKSQAKSIRLKNERKILEKRHPEYMINDPYKGASKDFELAIEKRFTKRNEVALIKDQRRDSNDIEGWVYTCFEELEVTKESGAAVFITRGFALVPGIDNMRFDFDMILEKDDKQYIIPLKRCLRNDLSGRFNGTCNTELCGFNQRTELNIEAGEYSIKIYAKDHGNVREIITDTGRAISI